MRERRRDLLYIKILILLVAVFSASRHCFASSGEFSLRSLIAEEAAGKEATARKKMMLDYATYVNDKNEIMLRDFHGGDDAASRALRGKAALVLHLLRRVAGDEAFLRATREIPGEKSGAPLSWDDIRSAIDKETGKDFGWFFRQWVDRKGLPELRVDNASVRRSGSSFEVSFDLSQSGEVYSLEIPVFISFMDGGGKTDLVRLDEEKKHVVLIVDGEPSVLEIDPGYDIPRKLAKTEEDIRMELRKETPAVEVAAIESLAQVIEAAADKKIVYVGEYHDRFAHHEVELRVIQGMYRRDPKIAIGMEMFQRPFQAVLDDYIAGAIDEREFLKKSEYFERWSLDYNLYKPILDFARAERIPVIALNVRSEIVDKVSKSGTGSLTDEERKEIPAQMDFSDSRYRERLRKVFAQHRQEGEKNFEFFYQAQILWDETMAMSVDEYLRKNPDRRMAVIAGAGHLAYRSGIPGRVSRRGGYAGSVVILNDADVERGIADYLVFPPTLEGVTAPKLMVVLKDTGGKVVIEDMPGDSVSRKAGLKKGDTIVSIDGTPVQKGADVRLELFYKKPGDEVRIKAMRKWFLLGERESEFVVKLR